MPKFLISAGEASGDYHGAALARALLIKFPDAEIKGIGGIRMKEAGVELLADIKDLNVMDFFSVLAKLWQILKINNQLIATAKAWRPDAVIFIDFPDFNLRAAKKLDGTGIHTVYFIPPKAWAWRKYRVHKIIRHLRQILVILPFEVEFYREHGGVAEFIGNPLMDDCIQTARPDPEASPIVGLAPGSRKHEIDTLLGPMLDAVALLRKDFPTARFVLPVASTVDVARLQPAVDAGVELVAKPLPEVMAQCDFAWVASGTAALETALVEVPMAVVYKMAPFSFAIARHLVTLTHVSLPNILAGHEIVPEFLQETANGENIAREAVAVLRDPALRRKRHADLNGLRELLGKPGAAGRAADAIIRKLELQKT